MPVYEYQCPAGHVTEEYRSVESRSTDALCRCGAYAQKVILHAPRVFGDYEGYESPASGRWIEGRRAREEDLRATGCRPYEAGETEDLVRRQATAERALDKSVDEAVDQTLREMSV